MIFTFGMIEQREKYGGRKMVLGEILKESRINKGYSRRCNRAFTYFETIHFKWKNGNSYPDLDNLAKLSTYYEVSIDEKHKKISAT